MQIEKKIKIRYLIKTCSACPSQWEGITKESPERFIYIRYRWGILTVGIGNTRNDAIANCDYKNEIGGEYDGVLLYEDICKILKDKYDMPNYCYIIAEDKE